MATDSYSLNQRFIYFPLSALMLSIGLHLLLPILFLGLKSFEHFPLPWAKKKDLHQVYQDFIQVDVVALPDAMFNQKIMVDTSKPIVEKPKLAPEEVAEKNKEETMALEREKAQKAEKEKAMAEKAKKEKAEKEKQEKQRVSDEQKALKKIQEEAKREQALKALQEKRGKDLGREKLKNNKLATGVSANGKIGEMREIWGAKIQKAIKDHFNVFLWQQKKGISNDVRIELYPNGRLKSRRIIRNSTDPTYDSTVLQAIDEVQVFPLPDDMSLLSEPIIVRMVPFSGG